MKEDKDLFIHNLRSQRQWKIIRGRVDFADKRVIDYGCGMADLLRHALIIGGARYCAGVEEDKHVYDGLLDRFPRGRIDPAFRLFSENAETFVTKHDRFDVGICCAVLPYLEQPDTFPSNMKDACKISIVECQYAGDGPGFPTLLDDDDMEEWLGCHWQSVEPIGSTLVEYRNVQRTIWLCQ